MEKRLQFWQVDSFTKEAFKGNPAAVVILEEEISDDILQNIAVEMNLSETAFIYEKEQGKPLLRWFTPMVEIDLCGHATLAAAHIYLTELRPDLNEVVFDTKWVGELKVEKSNLGYSMNFPQRPGEKLEINEVPDFVLSGISKEHKPHTAYKSRDLMLVYDNADIIRNFKVDFNALAQYPDFIIVTAKSDDAKYDFISRFFCADDGISEDPVTGSAHCTSTPYWSKQLNKTSLKAYQASKRGGEIDLLMTEDRVIISGPAVTVIEGALKLASVLQSV